MAKLSMRSFTELAYEQEPNVDQEDRVARIVLEALHVKMADEGRLRQTPTTLRLARALRQARRAKRYGISFAAKRAKVGTGFWHMLELGLVPPSQIAPDTMERIVKLLSGRGPRIDLLW